MSARYDQNEDRFSPLLPDEFPFSEYRFPSIRILLLTENRNLASEG